jgi:hypothetical protein
MKQVIILAIFLILIAGCSSIQDSIPGPTSNTTSTISGIKDLVLNEQDLQQLGLARDFNEQDLQQLGITGNGTNCQSDEQYTAIDSSQAQHNLCVYTIPNANNTQIIIELTKFANLEDLNGTYQYSSLHLFSSEGIISENTFGDQSRFRVNNVNDYGGQFNDPNIYYYHLWICKDKYMIHITSGGSKDAKDYIAKTGRLILSKFE